MIGVDEVTFMLIVICAAVAAATVMVLPARLAPPVVVLELVLGILIGPDVLGIAELDDFSTFFQNLGLAMLFFFAGYELDLGRLRGGPLRLAAFGWLLSVALAYALGGMLVAAGLVISSLYTGSAMATTALGTLIPILRDSKLMETRFGSFLQAAGAVGEFGPILLVTLFLSSHQPIHNAAILIAFVAVSVALAIGSTRVTSRAWKLFERSFDTSGQLAVRVAMVLVFALVGLAAQLGLDVLLGGFVGGMIARASLRGHEVEVLESKLTGIGFGFLVPFFFVASGMAFDLDALLDSTDALLELPIYLVLMLAVRALPALLLYRGVMALRSRVSLGFFCATQLPLVVAITTIAVDADHMHPATASALVGAAILSTLIYPMVGLLVKGRGEAPALELETAG